jgi:hypothetical protein
MHTVGDQNPTRRKGEANYRGPNATRFVISPGRRRGEPNHQAWTKFKVLNLVADTADVTDQDCCASASNDQSPQPLSENARVSPGALSNSLATLHSVIEALPDLARLLSLLAEENGGSGFGADHPGRRKGDRVRSWTIDDAVEIHNLCSETRRTGRNGPQATSRYQNGLKPDDNNILPPTYPFRPGND